MKRPAQVLHQETLWKTAFFALQKRFRIHDIRFRSILKIAFPLLLIFTFAYLLIPKEAFASLGNTRTINFQGRVINKSDGTNVTDGTYSFTFKLYDAASGGNLIWQETQSSVQVTSGIFNVQLGSSTAFNANPYNVNFNSNPLYLDITFNSETFGSRVQLSTVPYALNAETLDGVIATSSATGFTLQGGQSTSSTASFTTSGSTLTLQPGLTGALTVQANGSNALTLTGGAASVFNTTSGNIKLQPGGSGTTANVQIGEANGAGGSSTPDILVLDQASGSLPTGVKGGLIVDSANHLNFYDGTAWKSVCNLTDLGCGAGGGGARLDQITAANTTATIVNGDNAIVWNWAPTTAGRTDFTFGATAAPASGTNTALAVSLTHTANTETNGLLVNVNGSGGTTTNGIQISQTAGTLTNGLTFAGTMTNYVNATNFTVTSGGALSNTSHAITPGASTIGLTITQSNVPTVDLASISNSGQTATTNGVNALQLTFDGGTGAGNQNGALRVNINNKNASTGGQENGIRIVATGAGTGINSNTVGLSIDALTSASNVATGENAIQVGSGWDNAISAAGNIELEAKTNTADSQANYWTDRAVAAGTLNTTAAIASISASAVYNGSLYAGTYNNSKAEVYRYNGSGTSWTALNGTAGTLNTTVSIDGITSMAVYNGYLYVGTSKVAGQAEIYRYDGGSTFTPVDTSAGSIGGVTAIASVSAMTVWNGDLYAGVCKSNGAEIFKYQGGTTWLPVSGAGTIATTTGVNCITSLVSYNNFLIAGDAKPAQAEVYRYTGGTTWIRLNPTAGTFTTTSSGGTAASSVDAVTAMTVYDGHLLVGLRKNAGGDLMEYVDNTAALSPVNDWARLNNAAGTIVSGGNTINSVSALGIYNGVLYVGTEATNGAEIWKYTIGEVGSAGWTKVSQATKGIIGSTGTPTTNIGMVTQLLQYNNDFWSGTFQQPGGAGMYSLTVVSGQSYALKFHAAATQSEQNGLQNLGSISFVASPSANVNTAGGGTGAFIFSNTIQTANGAYDVAEDYPTRDNLIQPGDLVAIDTKEKGMVKRSDGPNSTTVIGVYSEHPGFDLSQTGNTIDGVPAIPVALVGRVPVRVSTESGVIKSGDYITSSSISGVGMKATTAGPIIGQALEDFDPSKVDANGIEQVLVFVSHGYFNGISQDALSGLTGSGDLSAVQFIGSPNSSVIASDSVAISGGIASSSANPRNDELTLTGLEVNGLATVSADFRVQHNALIEGILTVADTIMANNFIVNGMTDFFGQVLFHGDIIFQKAPTFSQDSAGLAVIQKGANYVNVKFVNAYSVTPIVNATLVSYVTPTPSVDPLESLQATLAGNSYSYTIANITQQGFTIVLSKKATDNVTFSWNALMVQNPSTQTSDNQQVSASNAAVAGAADISPAPLASSSGQ